MLATFTCNIEILKKTFIYEFAAIYMRVGVLEAAISENRGIVAKRSRRRWFACGISYRLLVNNVAHPSSPFSSNLPRHLMNSIMGICAYLSIVS